jgi:TRAP-type C4-dicarboxylate transport system permease small subunit
MSAKRVFVHKVVAAFFVLVLAAMMWPIYPLFSRIHPMVLGMPFSLFYLILLITISFLVLLGLYLWESRESERQ